jgi:hypothetical protein
VLLCVEMKDLQAQTPEHGKLMRTLLVRGSGKNQQQINSLTVTIGDADWAYLGIDGKCGHLVE